MARDETPVTRLGPKQLTRNVITTERGNESPEVGHDPFL